MPLYKLHHFLVYIAGAIVSPPEHKYCYKGQVSKGNEDKPLNWLAYDANIHDEEGPHIYISRNLPNELLNMLVLQS